MTALFAQIFPVILLALAVESGRVSTRIRRRPWWSNWLLVPSVAVATVGFSSSLISTAWGGADEVVGRILWALMALSLLGLFVVILAILATDEITAEETTETPQERFDRQFRTKLLNDLK